MDACSYFMLPGQNNKSEQEGKIGRERKQSGDATRRNLLNCRFGELTYLQIFQNSTIKLSKKFSARKLCRYLLINSLPLSAWVVWQIMAWTTHPISTLAIRPMGNLSPIRGEREHFKCTVKQLGWLVGFKSSLESPAESSLLQPLNMVHPNCSWLIFKCV